MGDGRTRTKREESWNTQSPRAMKLAWVYILWYAARTRKTQSSIYAEVSTSGQSGRKGGVGVED